MADGTNATNHKIKEVYANDLFVDIGESEISLLFSSSFYAEGGRQSKPSVRVILSHDNYVKMVNFLERRAKLLRRAYMNRTPNLYAGDAEELREAFNELYPPPQEVSPEDATQEEKS